MPELFLMVGLPGAGKSTRAGRLAIEHRALRLSPDEWMLPLFGVGDVDGRRDIVEARLIRLAWDALHVGTNVVLDFGFWGRDERTAIRWLATGAGAVSHLVYLPVDHATQLERVAHRQATKPWTTVPITEADLHAWRAAFEEPDEAELSGTGGFAAPPQGSVGWLEWLSLRWPTLTFPEGEATGPGRADHARPEPA
ncbi:ATP-binding protein [Catenulispora sp. NF23]|uniref:ATP-binding protein n=1 Tax=Catenulispora pinistramenti TaxID=2705254 RepID=A0ABS5L455_9ACTN|nr:ATP-binding protein [Catenulispora pinistramenti]MBS2537060.1 ATP-binding protein [Catenulispora pinistramenti]MBS2552914.1 ATP-binding protein [Catenulispora pinistramenti]